MTTTAWTKGRNTLPAPADRIGMPPCPPDPSRYGPAAMSPGAAATATDYRALLARQDWSDLRKKLKLFAYKATGSRSMDRAEDLAQDAIARVWEDAGVRWRPEVEPSLFRFLTGLVRGDLSNERRRKRTSSEVLAGAEVIEAAGDGGRGAAERLLILDETSRRVLTALRERTAKDPIATEVTELFERGVDVPRDQAEASDHSIEEIRRARRRVFDHAKAVRRELVGTGEVT